MPSSLFNRIFLQRFLQFEKKGFVNFLIFFIHLFPIWNRRGICVFEFRTAQNRFPIWTTNLNSQLSECWR